MWRFSSILQPIPGIIQLLIDARSEYRQRESQAVVERTILLVYYIFDQRSSRTPIITTTEIWKYDGPVLNSSVMSVIGFLQFRSFRAISIVDSLFLSPGDDMTSPWPIKLFARRWSADKFTDYSPIQVQISALLQTISICWDMAQLLPRTDEIGGNKKSMKRN